jgi:hypothetical protein
MTSGVVTEGAEREFRSFQKIPRLNRDCVITEKIDGTNASIWITTLLAEPSDVFPAPGLIGHWVDTTGTVWGMWAGKRTSWVTPENDNYGFAKWVEANFDLLRWLGPGRHFGEWWGSGIQRRYGMVEKVFSLFPTKKPWTSEILMEANIPVRMVPLLYKGPFSTEKVKEVLHDLEEKGSTASPGFMDPEGVVVYHEAAGTLFKVTIKDDEKWEKVEGGQLK